MRDSSTIDAPGRLLRPGQTAVEALRANGVEVVFGLNGDHVLELYRALAEEPSIRHITVKHENNAAIAAEAYGRLTGRPGVVVVTAGPGALNSISGVAGALASGAPMVHLSGAVPADAALESFHGVDRPDFSEHAFAAVTKRSTRVTAARAIGPALTGAFALSVRGRPGPVHVEITRDVLEGDPVEQPPIVAVPAPTPLPVPDVDRLVERLRAASRVLIVAGKGAWYPLVSAALVRLAEALEAPVAHTWEGHGAMPTVHPLSLGPYRLMGTHPAVDDAIRQADLVLGIGLRPGIEAHRALRAALGDRLVVLDAADAADGSEGPPIDSVPALAATLEALAGAVRPGARASESRPRCAEARRLLARGLDVELERHSAARPWHIGLALRALDERLDADTIVTSDVSNVKLWAPLQLRTHGPHSHVQAGSWGTMGYALPAAIGAASAFPGRKVVALAGDASFLMSTSDLVTLAQHRLPIVIAVHHDGQIGMINYMQRMAGMTPYATDVGEVDYRAHAEASGVRGIRVDDPAQIGPAWDDALAADGPVLLELMAGHAFPRPSVERFVGQGA